MFDHYYAQITYSRPEFLYFWGYYFFMNFIWMVFPGSKSKSRNLRAKTAPPKTIHLLIERKKTVLLVSSVRKIAKTFQALDKLTANGKANGHANKKTI